VKKHTNLSILAGAQKNNIVRNANIKLTFANMELSNAGTPTPTTIVQKWDDY